MNFSRDRSLFLFARYLIVGGFNTVFGYVLFAFLNWLFMPHLGKYSYMYASCLASILSITVAFLGYKWLVFQTRGNYLREWIRCVGVYGSSALIGLIGMPILVPMLQKYMHRPEHASYLAGAIMMVITVLFSFFGHKKVSFRKSSSAVTEL